ncbi:hypothetical protein EDB85DRAFT_2019923 [Lactarius pseudohatsudake]|nr:hypothetical protein EDB85DRAFT_2019923 [Lactarius pseudohatsudake]
MPRGLCLLGQRAMTLCRGALGLSDPTWYIRLPPVSEDKGQYSMPRGGQSQAVSSDLPGELAGIARRGATPGRLVAIWVSVTSQHGIGTALPHAPRAAKTGNLFRGPGCSFSTPCGPHQRGHIAVGPLCHPKIR